MIKSIVIILLLFKLGESQPSWYPPEKYQPAAHFLVSGIICVGTYYLWKYSYPTKDKDEKLRRLMWNIPISLIPGLIKEKIDMDKNEYFNHNDMYYNTTGSIVAGSIIFFFEF